MKNNVFHLIAIKDGFYPKYRKRAMTSEDMEKLEPLFPVVGVENGTAAMENWRLLEAPQKVPENSTPRDIAKRTESRTLKRYPYTHVLSIIILSSQKVEAAPRLTIYS